MQFNAINQWDMEYHQSRPALPFAGYTTYMDVWAFMPCEHDPKTPNFDETILSSIKLQWMDKIDLLTPQTWHSMSLYPYQYLWMSGDNMVIRRRNITLTQMAEYDLNHPVIAPAPKFLTRKALAKLRDTGVIHPRARITQGEGERQRHTDFYDVVDVIFALHMRQRNGRNFDMTRINEFWGIRLAKYAEQDATETD